jgi:two-component system nitrate/nitrite response regulator NarL
MKTGQTTTSSSAAKTAAASLTSSTNRVPTTQKATSQGSVPGQARTVAKTKSRIRVLVVDDHPIVRKGLSSCLARQHHLEIVGEAGDGREGLAKARELLPDVVLMDIDMPHMSGLAVAEVLRKELPQIKVVILSMYRQKEYVLRILQSGAQGYILKDADPDELVAAIDAVVGGQTYFSPDIARVALNQFVQGTGQGPDPSELTQREREVLVHIAEGCSNKEIACNLGVGVRTVETHRERIMRKLNIHSIAGLTRFAIAKGVVTLREDIRR